MSNYSEGFELFLKGYSGDLGQELAEKIVDRLGGEKEFLNIYERINDKGMIWALDGWVQSASLAIFFEDNRKLFMNFMKGSINHTEHKSIAALVMTFDDIKKIYRLDIDQVSEGLKNIDSENHVCVTAEIPKYASEVLSKRYVEFLEYHPDGTPSYSEDAEYSEA